MSQILENLTLDELDEIFAVEVCGTLKPAELRDGAPRAYEDTRTGAYRDSRWRDYFTDFTRDANAVIPWLFKERVEHNRFVSCGPTLCAATINTVLWSVTIADNDVNSGVTAFSDSFACACVLALIKVRRKLK